MKQTLASKPSKTIQQAYQDCLGIVNLDQAQLEQYLTSANLKQKVANQLSFRELLEQYVKDKSSKAKDPLISQMSRKNLEGLYAIGYEAFQKGQYQVTVEMCQILFILNPIEAKYTYCLGLALEQQARYFTAASAFLLNSQIDSKNPYPLYKTYQCFQKLDQKEAASTLLQAAIKRCMHQAELADFQEIMLREFNLFQKML